VDEQGLLRDVLNYLTFQLSTEKHNKFTTSFSGPGVNRFKVAGGAENKRACRFYEKNGGILANQIEVHRGEQSNVYLFESLPI